MPKAKKNVRKVAKEMNEEYEVEKIVSLSKRQSKLIENMREFLVRKLSFLIN